MYITVLKSKIYRATISTSSVEYSGSLGINPQIMEQAKIYPYEKLLVVNINTGDRFETYCIPERAGHGDFSLYGGAARLGFKGDKIIIMTFARIIEEDAKSYKPTMINYQ